MHATRTCESDDANARRELHRIQSFGFTISFLPDRMMICDRKGQTVQIYYNRAQVLQARHANAPAPSPRPDAGAGVSVQLTQAVEKIRAITVEREQWKTRALAAELQLKSRPVASSKYQKLKAFLAKEFHPDNSSVAGLEKLVRTELFKAIWPKIQEIDEVR